MLRTLSALVLSCVCVSSLAQESTSEVANVTAGPKEALVYFVRPGSLGFAINFWAFVDERAVGMTKGDQHVTAAVPAGEHVIWSRSGNVSSLKMNLMAGETYYIKQTVKMGGIRARVDLEVLDAEAGKKAVADTKPADADFEAARGDEISSAEYAEAVSKARSPTQ